MGFVIAALLFAALVVTRPWERWLLVGGAAALVGCVLWLKLGDVRLEDPLETGASLLSITGCLVAFFAYAVAIGVCRRKAASPVDFVRLRAAVRRFFVLYGGLYLASSYVVRLGVFGTLGKLSWQGWKEAGVVTMMLPYKWVLYALLVGLFHLWRARRPRRAPGAPVTLRDVMERRP